MRGLLAVTAILMMIPGVSHAGGGGVDRSACAGFGEGATMVMQDSCFATVIVVSSGTKWAVPAMRARFLIR